ncbi:uncharacterized protein LOC117781022 isoform X2 [Drosophila innubila]|uniref:uncharacterized protein LOC117781022 isoform X2 n=1 Tax=Drosophila innubila TaxID=198719 RepID=UPI00148DCF4F|nr:uncharacterized protein LOC117781022 isoform X2 [Drosophila innubila]
MKVLDKLIVSPTNVKFQAPFPHNQKRQLSLLNVSDKDLVYLIELDNEELFQVIPSRGSLDAYDTIELTLLMKPAPENLSSCVMKVKYMLKPEDASEDDQSDRSDKTVEDPAGNSAADWSESHRTQVNISLENCVETEEEMRQMFALDNSADNVARILEKNYQPVCTNCCLKRTNPRDLAKTPSWQRLFFWPIFFALLFPLQFILVVSFLV